MFQDQLEYIRGLSTKSHSKTYLVCSLMHRIRENTVDSYRSQQEREKAEDGKKGCSHAWRPECLVDYFGYCVDAYKRHIGIHLLQLASHCSKHSVRISLCPYVKGHSWIVVL